MLATDHLYERAYQTSQHASFRIEDLIGKGQELDFDKPFLPESLARTNTLSFLSARERMVLNQIRGNTYLCMFGIVEEFILPYLLDHLRGNLDRSEAETRAILQFASEEAKHIDLFRRFQKQFARGFGTPCQVIGPASEIGKVVLAHPPLAVGLAILMIEWMTQAHYIESVRDNSELDPHFKNLLKHHWIEEARHAQIDALMVESYAAGLTAQQHEQAFAQYLEIGKFLDAGLAQQLELELSAFQQKTGRVLTQEELSVLRPVQLQALRYTFLGSGMHHPKFRASIAKLSPALLQQLDGIAPAFC